MNWGVWDKTLINEMENDSNLFGKQNHNFWSCRYLWFYTTESDFGKSICLSKLQKNATNI
jgi:hypothetical protein